MSKVESKVEETSVRMRSRSGAAASACLWCRGASPSPAMRFWGLTSLPGLGLELEEQRRMAGRATEIEGASQASVVTGHGTRDAALARVGASAQLPSYGLGWAWSGLGGGGPG